MYRGMPSRRSLVPAFLTAAILALALNAHSSAPDRLYVRAKKSQVISDWAAAAIDGAAKAGRAKVWVFFTDKGFFDDRGMMAEMAQKNTDRKSTRLNSSHSQISYAVFCLKK